MTERREALDPEGDLAAVVANLGGSPRAGQVWMAQVVAGALAEGTHLMVQAGTGTGKSFGYLVPAMAHALERGERVVVSTGTLALQRQLLVADAPRVADVIEERRGTRPTVAVLKGWQNYLCRYKVDGGYPPDDDALFSLPEVPGERTGDKAADHPAPAGGPDVGPRGAAGGPRGPGGPEELGAQIVRLRAWAEETGTGDRDDLEPGVSARAWAQVSVSKLECLGTRCPAHGECFAVAARDAAAEADVVLTNHAMLGIAAAGNPGVLPEHDVLVVDEAHDLADRVTASGTLDLSAAAVRRAARLAARAGASVHDLESAGSALAGRLEVTAEGRLLGGLNGELSAAVTAVMDAARQAVSDLKGGSELETSQQGARQQARAAALTVFEICEAMLGNGGDGSDGGDGGGDGGGGRSVLWCARPVIDGREIPPRLHLAALDVAGMVARGLLAERSAIFTSATLALGGSFDQMARTLGLPFAEEPWEGVDVGSPFDHARQGILYVARHLPRAGRDGTSPEVLEELTELVRAAGGRTLGLFTSRRAAQAAAQHLRAHLDTPVLCQGEDQLPTLVRRFARDEATTLVGTLSLWQGVDVPGPTCSLVVIDRLPFPRPDDPIASARVQAAQRSGANGFMAVSATHAALLLAQGAGRLVRRSDDRGVVAVLDPRLATARYGAFLLRSLPDFWRTEDREVVLGALRRLAGARDAGA